MTNAINAAMTNTPLEMPFNRLIFPPYFRCHFRSARQAKPPAPPCLLRGRGLLPRQLVPPPHVGDAFLISRNHHFRSLGNRDALFAARRDRAPRALLRVNHFP